MFRITLIIFLLIFSYASVSEADEASRYEVEAAFVFKFIKFINWPDEQTANFENIDLCYVGKGNIESSLKKLEARVVKNKTLKIRNYNKIKEIKTCQIVFIDINIKSERKKYIEKLKEESILTISHFEGFIDDGGMINLLIVDNRVNFEINFISTQRSNLRVSSKLLKLAKRIITEKRDN